MGHHHLKAAFKNLQGEMEKEQHLKQICYNTAPTPHVTTRALNGTKAAAQLRAKLCFVWGTIAGLHLDFRSKYNIKLYTWRAVRSCCRVYSHQKSQGWHILRLSNLPDLPVGTVHPWQDRIGCVQAALSEQQQWQGLFLFAIKVI